MKYSWHVMINKGRRVWGPLCEHPHMSSWQIVRSARLHETCDNYVIFIIELITERNQMW